MTVTVAQFRADFPEFADTSKYPDASVAFWLNVAVTRLNPTRWADMLDMGTELFIAHQVVLSARNARANTPGATVAPIASKSVDKVSVSYDTSAVRLDNAGHWAATNYGQQFWQLLQMAGAGGVQLI